MNKLKSIKFFICIYIEKKSENFFFFLQIKSYLKFKCDGVDLRQNYIDITLAIGDQLEQGVSFRRLLGVLDDPKARSSLQLFERISFEVQDKELNDACVRVMKLIDLDVRRQDDYIEQREKHSKPSKSDRAKNFVAGRVPKAPTLDQFFK